MFFPTEPLRRTAGLTSASVLLSILLFTGCLHDPQGVSPQPELDLSGFAMVWDSYEGSYPLFVVKGIEWMEVCEEYYPMAVDCDNDEDLREVIAGMLGELQDPALILVSPELQDTIRTFEKQYQFNVDTDVLMENYLEPNGFQGYAQGFGWCDPEVLPYAFFDTLPTGQDTLAVAALDSFVSRCVELDVPAVILDVRMNPSCDERDGLFHNFDRTVMARFIDKARVCGWYRVRSGLVYDQFHDWHPWIVPEGPVQYNGTVYLLAGGGCLQAAEDMVVNMENFPHVVVLGDTTGGSITETGDFIPLGMENGWMASSAVSTLLTYDKDYVEGNGFPPDIYIEATPGDFAAGVDPVMEYAMEMAGSNPEL
ncbi:MAG TPA: S41 family peptidase [Candidatus Sabulitectum sp.]|nr:S41 family peptidase [Candidatus Sabulitectum sp.]HPF32055.1 S41 family peptidase [Candidatus Sabulitectum sp.]HPJ29387.1 S41 family peptidase [Candidatus Sabulitectum sp.]HPR23124.1 S41 family peptidase [Candidatus Sabulitectum sp.]